MLRDLHLLALALLLLLLCSCGGRLTAVNELGHLSINVSALADSQVKAGELAVKLSPAPDGQSTEVSVSRLSSLPAASALLELHFDAAYAVQGAQAPGAKQAQLALLVTDKPGLLALGLLMPSGHSLGQGELLHFNLVPAAAPRETAKAPSPQGGVVTELSATPSGGGYQLDWGYVNQGDYNQDGLVNVADLSQIGIHFQEAGPWGYNLVQRVVDGTPDGVISVADLTPIGLNYLRKVSGYLIYKSSSASPSAASVTQVGSAELASASGDASSRKRFSVTLGAGVLSSTDLVCVAPQDAFDSSLGPYSNVVDLSGGLDTTAPVWTSAIGVLGAIPGNNKVTVAWGEATDAQSPPVTYTVYYQQGATVDFASAQTATAPAPAQQLDIPGLTNGQQYSFAVRAKDSAAAPNEEQNNVVLSATPAPGKIFTVPPSGTQTPDGQTALNPDLVEVPLSTANADQNAPAIFCLRTDVSPAGNHLYCVHYQDGAWVAERILQASSYVGVSAIATSSGPGELTFNVWTYDNASGKLLHLRFDDTLTQVGSEDVFSNPTLTQPLAVLSVDYDSASDTFGVAHGYSDTTTGNLQFSRKVGAANYTTFATVYSGDRVFSAGFKFDPAGGQPWLAFSHGTVDTSTANIDFNVSAETGRFNGASWDLTPLDYTDNPIALNLSFAADNTPLLAFTAVRPLSIASLNADVLFDMVRASNNGVAWTYNVVYTAAFTPHVGFPSSTLDVSIAPGVSWAGTEELVFPEITGSAVIDTLTQAVTGGNFNIVPHYRTAALSSYATDSAYFTGDSGVNFSWAPGAGGPCAAYTAASTLSATDLLAGNFGTGGALLYWSP